MDPSQEDFVFAEHVLKRGFATEAQVEECLGLLQRLRGEMQLDESLGPILVKKGYLAQAQADAIQHTIRPGKRSTNQIEGYRLIERVGAGAMGSVYKAEHLKLHIFVALKVLRLDHASSRTQIERLKREARLAAQLDHRNIVRSMDVGESNGLHYFCMEFVDGKTVREHAGGEALPEMEAVRIVRDVARALEHAHQRGVIHRDVKPGNVMMTPDGEIKLGDFGLARGQEPSDLTLETASIGTPQYIAPEQARRGSDATLRSDLFSLGATLYHLVTGRPPFHGENLGEIFQKVLTVTFAPPESLQPDLGVDTTYVIHRLMRGNPRERYASATELLRDLDAILDRKRVAPLDYRGDYRVFLARRKKRRFVLVSSGVAALIALVVGGSWWSHQKSAERERVALCASANRMTFGECAIADSRRMQDARQRIEKLVADNADVCRVGELGNLKARGLLIQRQAHLLAQAEQLREQLQRSNANFRKLEVALGALPGASDREVLFQGVVSTLDTIAAEINQKSNTAAENHRTKVYDSFHETAAAAITKLRGLADGLDTRYVLYKSPGAQRVRLDLSRLERLHKEWVEADSSAAKQHYDEKRAAGNWAGAYVDGGEWLVLRNTAYQRAQQHGLALVFLRIFSREDPRSREIEVPEKAEWSRLQTDLRGLRLDRVVRALHDFRPRARYTEGEVLARIRSREADLKELQRSQEDAVRRGRPLVNQHWSRRAYGEAHAAVVQLELAREWQSGPASELDRLRRRCGKLLGVADLFFGNVAAEKRVEFVRGGQRIRIKPSVTGVGKDRVVVGTINSKRKSFALNDFDTDSFVKMLRLDDGALKGYVLAIESLRVFDDPARGVELLNRALAMLGNDDWATELTTRRDLLLKDVQAREKRAAELWLAAQASRGRNEYDQALEHCETLLGPALRNTNVVAAKRARIVRMANEARQNLGGDEYRVALAVPKENFTGNPEGGLVKFEFTFERWYPYDAQAGVTDPKKAQEEAAKKYWAGFYPKDEDGRLRERAMHQLRVWSKNVRHDDGAAVMTGGRLDNYTRWRAAKMIEPVRLRHPLRADKEWAIELSVAFDHRECGVFAIGLGRIRVTVLAAGGWSGSPLQIGGGRGTLIRIANRANRPFEDVFKDFYEQRLLDPGVRRRINKDSSRTVFTFSDDTAYRVRLERKEGKLLFFAVPLADWKKNGSFDGAAPVVSLKVNSKAELVRAAAGSSFELFSLARARFDDVWIQGTLEGR